MGHDSIESKFDTTPNDENVIVAVELRVTTFPEVL